MPKKFYCSKCGIELKHERKAVSGRGIILDLIEPHECEGFSIKSNNDKLTVEDIINNLQTPTPVPVSGNVSSKSYKNNPISDKRTDIKTSSAPENLLDSIRRNRS